MHFSKRNILRTLTALIAPIVLNHCGHAPTVPTDGVADQTGGTVRSSIVLGKVGTLSKTATISLQKLIVTAVSSATPADTVKDTSAVSGNSQVTVQRVLTLAPLRSWTISAKTLDLKDSVIHSGVTSSFFIKPADTVDVSLNLASRFEMYEAHFNTLPDSISSSTSGTGKDKLNLNRVVLKVDGVIKSDSVLASGYFTGNQTVNVFFDYIAPGSHTVTLEAYGVLHYYTGMLYSGSTTYTVTAGTDDTRTLNLNWVGPTTSTGRLTVVIGKVGKAIVNGGLPGAVIP